MGWLGNLLEGIRGKDSVDLIFVPDLAFPGIDTSQPINADEHYVELYVESLRIEKARSFATTFNGVVYSFVTLARRADQTAVLAAISKPQKLAELDAGSLDKVITVSKQMMGAVPWRGGDLGLELGLFSVKSGNILTPIVNFVSKVSEVAGISFVGAVKPFLPLITEGMDLIAGQPNDVKLEVGVDTNLALSHPMACAIIAAKQGSFDTSKLSVDGAGKLVIDGEPLSYGYCVFTVRSTTQKVDFGEIPELKERYADFQSAAMKRDQKAASDALAAFRLTALFSADLIQSDATRIVALAQSLYDAAFPQAAADTRDLVADEPVSIPESLAELPLYTAG